MISVNRVGSNGSNINRKNNKNKRIKFKLHAQKLFKPILSSFRTSICGFHRLHRTCDGQKFKWVCCNIDKHTQCIAHTHTYSTQVKISALRLCHHHRLVYENKSIYTDTNIHAVQVNVVVGNKQKFAATCSRVKFCRHKKLNWVRAGQSECIINLFVN